MSLFDYFSAAAVPPDTTGKTLVVGEPAVLSAAEDFLKRLEARFGPSVLGLVGDGLYNGQRPTVELPERYRAGAKRLRRLQPPRVIMLGRASERFELAAEAPCPAYWVNATDPRSAQAGCRRIMVAGEPQSRAIPGARLTGDPLLALETLPEAAMPDELCERFREFRNRGYWISYFAATGEGEEALAYGVFFELARQRQGLLVLAPRDPDRYEPVYRESLRYHLPTNRHGRLMTSYVPHQTRVYYVEDTQVMNRLYGCVDFVVAGATLDERARHAPDLITPMAYGRPVIVGPAHRRHPAVESALAARVVLYADHTDALVEACRLLANDPGRRESLAREAHSWLQQQVGAADRVLQLIE
ncbi:MAG TPA: 3-deoxy-D-manno-octulosonic acid transferase [Gammaproteobacteria bacterium]|nr:3-deoxy-D-manno-octulosonic acid transferase [Gammaproteobacteria bacterium]